MGSLVGSARVEVGRGDGVSVGVLVALVRVGWPPATSVGVRVGTMGSGVGLGIIVGICVGRLVESRVGCSSTDGQAVLNRATNTRKIPRLTSKSLPHGSSFSLLTPSPHDQYNHTNQHQPDTYAQEQWETSQAG